MSKSLLAGLKRIAQEHPETRQHLVPLFHQAAITRKDLAYFDKPGLYKPVQIQLMSGLHNGYLRDEEIQDGEKRLTEYIQDNKKHNQKIQPQFAAKQGDRYDSWVSSYKTPEKAEEAFEKWLLKSEAIERASSLRELAAKIAPIYEPADYKGRLMLLGSSTNAFSSQRGSSKALYRHTVVEQAEEEGPRSVLKLIAAGIQLEDRPGWGATADATRKAGEFLKRRKEQLRVDLRLQAEPYAEKTFAELAVKYPMADTKQLPGPTWLWGIFRDV